MTPAEFPDLTAWVAGLAADDAARDRARQAWLRRQAEDEGTFAGVLADLAERGRSLVVQLHNGRLHRGVLSALGADFVVVRGTSERDVLVRREAIASVRTLPGDPVTIGDRPVASRATFGEAMRALGEDRARVLVIGRDPASGIRGELRAVGTDVLTVRQDGSGATAYVALASVDEVSLAESG